MNPSVMRIPLMLLVSDGDDVVRLRIDANPDMTVLDMLETLRAETGGQPAVPAYRHSCHHGSCGTCGAVIDGVERLMCLTRAAELAAPHPRAPGGAAVPPMRDDEDTITVSVEPLRGMEVVSGIAVHPARVFAGIPRGASYRAEVADGERHPLPPDPTLADGTVSGNAGGEDIAGAGQTRTGSEGKITQKPPENPRRVRFESCLECGLCVSACPVTVPFTGPAALAAINIERVKHPENADAMMDLAMASDGVAACRRHLACSRVCPQAVYPGKHIQLLKNASGAF